MSTHTGGSFTHTSTNDPIPPPSLFRIRTVVLRTTDDLVPYPVFFLPSFLFFVLCSFFFKRFSAMSLCLPPSLPPSLRKFPTYNDSGMTAASIQFEKRGQERIELSTSCTQSRNHTPRPLTLTSPNRAMRHYIPLVHATISTPLGSSSSSRTRRP